MGNFEKLDLYRAWLNIRLEMATTPLISFGNWSTDIAPLRRPIIGASYREAPGVLRWSEYHGIWDGPGRVMTGKPPQYWCDIPGVPTNAKGTIWTSLPLPHRDLGPVLGMWENNGTHKPSVLIFCDQHKIYRADDAIVDPMMLAPPAKWTIIPQTPPMVDQVRYLEDRIAHSDELLAKCLAAGDAVDPSWVARFEHDREVYEHELRCAQIARRAPWINERTH